VGSDCAWIDNIVFPPSGAVAQEDIARLVVNNHAIAVNSIEVSSIPYETIAQVTVNFTNPSSITAQNITARLTSDHSSIQINNGTQTLPVPNMLQNDNESVTFPVKSISRNPISANVNFVFTLLYAGLEVDYPFSAHFEGIPQGINEVEEMACLVFPIPTKDVLNIQTELSINSVEIYDINGKLLKVISPNSDNFVSINVTSLSTGIYFVKVFDMNQKVSVKKFVKK
jgi:LEA14-like dessication related protein